VHTQTSAAATGIFEGGVGNLTSHIPSSLSVSSIIVGTIASSLGTGHDR
jgi:hypothetical protein